MKKFLFCFLIFPLLVQAQQVQYASKVLKYSTDLGGKQNSVKRVLGKPDAFPQGGPSANAWVSKDALGSAFVEVEFEKPQTVKQIAIFQNLNAGCVTRVQVGAEPGKLHSVGRKTGKFLTWLSSLSVGSGGGSNMADRAYYFNKKRRKIEKAVNVENNADIEYYHLETPEENVKVVRVDFNFALKPGQKQIDAIAISDNETPIVPVINVLNGAENLASPEKLIFAPEGDFDLSGVSILDNVLYYTISKYDAEGEIHALNLEKPTEIVDVTKKIRKDKDLNYILGYSPQTQTMLMGSENKFRQNLGVTGFDFFTYKDGAYTFQKPLKIVAYSNYGDYADAFFTKDGQRILFGLESDLTVGGFDLYFTQPNDEETFGILQNMGKGLNSAADETNPFLLSDNKTLLFASNGYSGYGDFDLYVATRLDDTWKNWSEPKNLGPKINGFSFDINPYYDEKTETLYYVSLRDGVSSINKVKIPISQLTGAK